MSEGWRIVSALVLLALPEGMAAVTGRVVDASGNPLAGVTVSLQRQSLSTQSDPLGRFLLGSVALRDGIPSEVKASGTRPSTSPVLLFPTPDGTGYSVQGRRHVEVTGPFKRDPVLKSSVAEDTLVLSKSGFLTQRRVVDDGGTGDIPLYAIPPGAPENFKGFDLHRFTVSGRASLVVVPKRPKAGNPWLWRTYFWAHKPAFDSIMASKGYYLAFMDIPNLYGAPQAVAAMDTFHTHLTTRFGFSRKANLVAISRGAFYAHNWGRANIAKVSTIYADGPGMDLVSWPCGCYGTGSGSAGDWTRVKEVYGFRSDAEGKAFRGNPYQNMKPFAEAKVPMVHVYGETDLVAPPKENVLAAADSVKAHGWQIMLLAKPNTGHTHGLDAADGGRPGQQDSLVNFVLRNTTY